MEVLSPLKLLGGNPSFPPTLALDAMVLHTPGAVDGFGFVGVPNGFIFFLPWSVTRSRTYNRIGIRQTALSTNAGLIRLGVCAADPATGLPGRLIADGGTVDPTTGAVPINREAVIPDWTPTPGDYWGMVVVDNNGSYFCLPSRTANMLGLDGNMNRILALTLAGQTTTAAFAADYATTPATSWGFSAGASTPLVYARKV